jgi:hypothetical protein
MIFTQQPKGIEVRSLARGTENSRISIVLLRLRYHGLMSYQNRNGSETRTKTNANVLMNHPSAIRISPIFISTQVPIPALSLLSRMPEAKKKEKGQNLCSIAHNKIHTTA